MPAAKDVMIFGKTLYWAEAQFFVYVIFSMFYFKGCVKIGSLVFSVNADNWISWIYVKWL